MQMIGVQSKWVLAGRFRADGTLSDPLDAGIQQSIKSCRCDISLDGRKTFELLWLVAGIVAGMHLTDMTSAVRK